MKSVVHGRRSGPPGIIVLSSLISGFGILGASVLRPASPNCRSSIVWVAFPLITWTCVVPVVYLLRRHRGTAALFILVLSVSYVDFGIRSLYLVWHPGGVTFPALMQGGYAGNLYAGMMWATAGIASTTVGYFWGWARATRSRGNHVERFLGGRQRLDRVSTVPFIAALYMVGVAGRAFSISNGSVLYLYNSPSFDQFRTRSTSAIGGIEAAMAELCPLAVASLLALVIMRRRRDRLLLFLLAVTSMSELAYYAFGLYKFGLFGIPIMYWVVLRNVGTPRARRAWVLIGVAALITVFPVVNGARDDLLAQNKSGLRPSSAWLHLFSRSAGSSLRNSRLSGDHGIIGPVLSRFNGAEALAAADRNSGKRPAYGRTYENLGTLALPSVLRGPMRPYYIPWETQYVGYSQASFNVVPMPTLVEAYLNFRWMGVLVVPLMLGLLYSQVDRLGRGRQSAFALGVYAYFVWRLSNIDQNVFVYLLPAMKVLIGISIAVRCAAMLSSRTDAVPGVGGSHLGLMRR